jgi:hypothetical protein
MHCIIEAVQMHSPASWMLYIFSTNTVTPKLNLVASPVFILLSAYITLYEWMLVYNDFERIWKEAVMA